MLMNILIQNIRLNKYRTVYNFEVIRVNILINKYINIYTWVQDKEKTE